jgi:hypothetical protein
MDARVATALSAEERATDAADRAIDRAAHNLPIIRKALELLATYGELSDRGFGPKIFLESAKGLAAVDQVNETEHSGRSNLMTANNILKALRGKKQVTHIIASIPTGFACKRDDFIKLCEQYGVTVPESNPGIPEELRTKINAAVAYVKPPSSATPLKR